jgi:hypothetical protein
VVEQVLRDVGSRPWKRDPIDQRIIDTVLQKTGRIIDSQEEVGGYPKPAMTTRALQPPATGLEAWLAGFVAAGQQAKPPIHMGPDKGTPDIITSGW